MGKKRAAKRHVLPKRPFLTGTWSFPFSPGVRGRTLLLAVLAFVVGVCVRESHRLLESGDGRLLLPLSEFSRLWGLPHGG